MTTLNKFPFTYTVLVWRLKLCLYFDETSMHRCVYGQIKYSMNNCVIVSVEFLKIWTKEIHRSHEADFEEHHALQR